MSIKNIPLVITGACGFIGRHVLERLCELSVPILAVDRVELDVASCPRNVRFHRSDFSDPSDLIPSDLDVSDGFTLLHLAWDMRRGSDFAPQQEQVRLLGSLLDYWSGRGLRHVVGLGSAEEYGARGGLLYEYDPPLLPLSPYGLAKRAAGEMVASWVVRERQRALWLRPFIVYGPGQRGSMMLPYAVAQAKARQPADFTDGLQERDFVYVDDVARAIVRSAEWGGAGFHVVNVATGRPTRVRDILLEVARLADAEALFRLGARSRRPGEPDRQVADIGVARDLLGWTPEVDWREGIAGTVEVVRR